MTNQPESAEKKSVSFRNKLIAAVVVVVIVAVALVILQQVLTKETKTVITFPGPKSHLTINVGSGDVTLLPASGSDISVTKKSRYLFNAPSTSEKDEATGVNIKANCSWEWLPGPCSASYEIQVPADVVTDVTVTNGSVSARNVKAALNVRTTNGPINARGSFGTLHLETRNGSVEALDTSSSETWLRSTNGDIRTEFVTSPAKVDAQTTNGQVDVVVPSQSSPFSVDANTTNGKSVVNVRTDPSSPFTIRAHSTNGNVKVGRK